MLLISLKFSHGLILFEQKFDFDNLEYEFNDRMRRSKKFIISKVPEFPALNFSFNNDNDNEFVKNFIDTVNEKLTANNSIGTIDGSKIHSRRIRNNNNSTDPQLLCVALNKKQDVFTIIKYKGLFKYSTKEKLRLSSLRK